MKSQPATCHTLAMRLCGRVRASLATHHHTGAFFPLDMYCLELMLQNCEHDHRKNGIKGKLIYEIKRSAEHAAALEDTWEGHSNKSDLKVIILVLQQCPVYNRCALSHLQLRNKGF